MTTEEIINAAIELVDYGTGQHNADSPIECFKKGAEFMDKHWQEKTRWIPVEERLPEVKKEPYCVLIKWEEANDENIDIVYIFGQREIDYMSLVKCKYWKEIEL